MEKLREKQCIAFVMNFESKYRELKHDIEQTELTYDEIYAVVEEQFKTLEKSLLAAETNKKKQTSNNRTSTSNESQPVPKSPELIEILTEKYRTPIVDKRMNSIKKPSTQKETTEENNVVVAKNKKRTAKAADISIVNEEEANVNQEADEETAAAKSQAVATNSSGGKKKRGRKPKAKKAAAKSSTEEKEEAKLVEEEQEKVDEKAEKEKRASKRMKINEPEVVVEKPASIEIVSEQQQAVVVDSSIEGDDKGDKKKRGRKKKAKEAKKPVEEEPVPVFKPTDVPKTPKPSENEEVKVNRNLSKLLQSTAKPMTRTRRAAKEAEAKRVAGGGNKKEDTVLNSAVKKPLLGIRSSVLQNSSTKIMARKSLLAAKNHLLNAAKTPQTLRKPSVVSIIGSGFKSVAKKARDMPMSIINKASDKLMGAANNRLTSNIDKHKARVSQNRPDLKKKSEVQVKAFQEAAKHDESMAELVRDRRITATSTAKKSTTGRMKKHSNHSTCSSISTMSSNRNGGGGEQELEDDDDVMEIMDDTLTSKPDSDETEEVHMVGDQKIIVRNHSEEAKRIHEEIIKSAKTNSTRKLGVDLVRLPSDHLSPTVKNIDSSKGIEIVKDQEKRLSSVLKPTISAFAYTINAPPSTTQPSRLLQPKLINASAIKGTPSRAMQFHSASNIPRPSIQKPSYTTPLKSSASATALAAAKEAEEKRKAAEFAAKEAKERERIAQMERQKQEKLLEAKKKREEKMKKVVDAKKKMGEEREQKLTAVVTETTKRTTAIMTSATVTSATAVTASSSVTIINPVVPKTALNPISNNLQSTANANRQSAIQGQKKPSLAPLNPLSKQPILETKKINPIQPTTSKMDSTYLCESPAASSVKPFSSITNKAFTSYDVTPLQPLKLKDADNYDVSELQSEDSDDEDQPKKPLPSWAQDTAIRQLTQQQQINYINFTRLFRAATSTEVDLHLVFTNNKSKKNLAVRSSSAQWDKPPVWKTGVTADCSFWQLKNEND